MRWHVQVEARFAHAHDLRVEDAVEQHLLEVGAIQPDTNGVQGDPGPRISAGITVDAGDADSAALRAGELLTEALERAGVGTDAYVLEVGHTLLLRGKWWSPRDRAAGLWRPESGAPSE
jgi:hypothetical protein